MCNKALSETKTPSTWFVDPRSTNSGACSGRASAYARHCQVDQSSIESSWSPSAPVPNTQDATSVETLLTKGNDPASAGGAPDGPNYKFIDTGAGAFDTDGELRSVKFYVASANRAGLKFQVYRPVSGNTYKLVGESEVIACPQARVVMDYTFSSPIVFKTGDFIGWAHSDRGTFPFVSGGQNIRYSGGMSSVGDSINFAGVTPRTYPYEVSYVASAVANPTCTVTRDGPYTLTRCGNGKVEVGYVMKGFDIKNLSPKAKAVLDTVRNGIQRAMAIKLGLREDQLVVAFKAGSIIVSVEVADDDMPASPVLGDGQDTLELVKATPGVADLVEAGKSLDDCFVDPEPAIQDDDASDEASATGDPHIVSVSGETFDMSPSFLK